MFSLVNPSNGSFSQQHGPFITRHELGEDKPPKYRLAPTVKYRPIGQESGGELCKIFKF